MSCPFVLHPTEAPDGNATPFTVPLALPVFAIVTDCVPDATVPDVDVEINAVVLEVELRVTA